MSCPQALIVVQAFPPLLKNAGGVAKRYITLCRALIDDLGWKVTILTPVDVTVSGEADVDRWLADGSLVHKAARGVRLKSVDGTVVVLDLFSFVNTAHLLSGLCLDQQKLREEGRISFGSSARGTTSYSVVFLDDLPWRLSLLLLARAAGVPTVMTSHTDGSKLKSYKSYPALKLIWQVQMRCAHLASVHASVSRVFGEQMRDEYSVPVNAIWPPILWAKEFKREPADVAEEAAAQRQAWLDALRQQGMVEPPTAILLFAGRWSSEKRIHLLLDVVPEGAALVIVGDGTAGYAQEITSAGATRPHVLALRKMLNGSELRLAYAAADLFCSASAFETLGNTLIEAWCSGTPCAVQPAQGHLEFVEDGVNSWFVDYDAPIEAKATLTRIVSGGLGADALARRLPKLVSTGTRFRNSDFAREFEQAVIRPALEERQRQRARGTLTDWAIRLLALAVWWWTWWLLRVGNRTLYAFSKEPTFEILGKLGGAVEVTGPKRARLSDAVNKLRSVLPILRPSKAAAGTTSASSGDEADSETPAKQARRRATIQDTDYESHFEGVHGSPWIDKLPRIRRSTAS